MKIHQQIKLLLKANGYTQKSAAAKIGVNRITIHRYVSGIHELKAADFCKLLDLAGVDLHDLIAKEVQSKVQSSIGF